MTESEQIESGKILYQECGTYLRYMLEWRYKLMLRFFVLNASFLVIVKWMWETNNSNIHLIIFLPFLLGAVASPAFYVLDRRNMKIVKVCRDTGKDLEVGLFKNAGIFVNVGPYIEQTRGFFSYTGMLALMYIGFAFIMLFGAILSFIKFGGWKLFSII